MTQAKLPVWAIVTRSYSWIRHHPRLLILPMGLLIGVEFLEEALSAQYLSEIWGKILSALVLMLIDGAFCVGLHRTIIIDEVRGGFGFLRWGFQLWRYLKIGLIGGLGAMLIGAALLFTVGAMLGGVDFQSGKTILIACVIAVPLLYLAARLFLALPAAALGQEKVFALSWRASKGNALRILAILLLTVFAPAAISGMLDLPASFSQNETLSLVFALLSSGLDVLGTALSTAALSFSYLLLVPAPTHSDRPPTDQP